MIQDDWEGVPGGSETVLVMEDASGVRRDVCQTLERLGYETLQAANLSDALRIARSQTVDVLLVDISLSMIAGLELAHAISTVRPETRVLYLSGIEGGGALGDRDGCHYLMGFLERPFSPAQLAGKIRELLDTRFPRPLPWTLSHDAVPNILVVDDDHGLRSTMARLLARIGYEVHQASNPNEAIRVVLSEPLDLIVMDVVLPRLNGLALAHTLSALRPGVRMLYTSGYSREDLTGRLGLPDPGVVAFLQKPFNPEGLSNLVAGLLDDTWHPDVDAIH